MIPKPALFTSRPKLVAVRMRAATRARGSSAAKSAAMISTDTGCAFAISAATAWRRSSRRATSSRSYPRAANWRANASPMPRDAPVTTASKRLPIARLIRKVVQAMPARGPLGSRQHQHGRQESQEDQGDGVLEHPVLVRKLALEPRPYQRVDVLEQFHQESHHDRRWDHTVERRTPVGQITIDQKEHQHGQRNRGQFKEQHGEPS